MPEDDSIARRPASVDFGAAGAAPLAGITALAAFDALRLSDGRHRARRRRYGRRRELCRPAGRANAGATVIAPGLPEDDEYLRGLGVSRAARPQPTRPTRRARRYPDGVDALLDLVSYSPDDFNANAGRAQGRRARPPRRCRRPATDPAAPTSWPCPRPRTSKRLAGLLDAGVLRVPFQAHLRHRAGAWRRCRRLARRTPRASWACGSPSGAGPRSRRRARPGAPCRACAPPARARLGRAAAVDPQLELLVLPGEVLELFALRAGGARLLQPVLGRRTGRASTITPRVPSRASRPSRSQRMLVRRADITRTFDGPPGAPRYRALGAPVALAGRPPAKLDASRA